MISAREDTQSVWVPRLLAALLIVGAATARIVYLGWLSPLDLAPDEAHYWDWSRQLDWSYYSKGPLVPLLIRASCELFGSISLAWTGSEMLAVRLPAVLCGSLLTLGLYVLAAQVWRREIWALGLAAVAQTMPMVAAGSTLMTIDAPFTCLWTWALVAGFEAVIHGRRWAWPAAGLCIALGILAKPTAVLWLPCFGLFLLMTPEVRPRLWRRDFWLLVGIASLGAAPILYWNYHHDWVTFLHTRGHAGFAHTDRSTQRLIYWTGPLTYLGTQMALLLVYWFLVWAGAMWRYRPWTAVRLEERYLWWMSAPIFVFFGLFSLKNGGGEPNWPIVAYLSGMVLGVGWIGEQLQSPNAWMRRGTLIGICSTACLGLVATLIVHFPVTCQPVFAALAGPATESRSMPIRRIDPTTRLRGWRTLAAQVDAVRGELRAQGIEPVLVGTNWILPGEIRFYLPDHPTVYSIGPAAEGDRRSQYDVWHPNPLADADEFMGKTFLIVNGELAKLKPAFDEVGSSRLIEHREGSQLVNSWAITVCHGYRGFPKVDKVQH